MSEPIGSGSGALAEGYADFARQLASLPSVCAVLHQLTSAAVAWVDGASAAGLSVLTDDHFETLAATGELPAAVDVLQYEYGGPCIAALLDSEVVLHADDLRTETRWPEFAAAALAQTPVLSMLSYRLYIRPEDPIASLNLYATKPHAFDADALGTGALLAAQAALGLVLAREREKAVNLQRALDSNRAIGAAMGIIMARELLTREQAFDRLRTASQHRNRKLRDLAADVVATGELT